MAIDPRIQGLLRQYEASRRQGKPLTAADLCRDCPELLEDLEIILLPRYDTGPRPNPAALDDTNPTPIRPRETLQIGHLTRRSASEPVPGYKLVRRIGRGGFGEVWETIGPGGVPVALKFVRLDEHAAAREAQALEFMKFINHPHLMTHLGIWSDDDLLIIGMELADGTLMRRLQEVRGAGEAGVPFAEVIEYMREAAKGIDYLNEPQHAIDGKPNVSVVHRDIKPHNLLLFGGSVKVADFGLARVLERSVSGKSGGMTVAYAPPEFFHGEVMRTSDQYSLACTYCELRGGEVPFPGTQLQMMAGHLNQSADLAMIPEVERPVVARALAKNPKDRWPSCRDFIGELAESGTRARRAVSHGPDMPRLVRNSVGMQLVLIPAGSFFMGSPDDEDGRQSDEGPAHRVIISRPFYLGIFPVTQREYQMSMGTNPSTFTRSNGGSTQHPVENVSWFDAVEFCRRLSARYEERQLGRAYYLPTEAEWEYACRAGTSTPFSFGSVLSGYDANFNGANPYGDASDGPFLESTSMVGSYAANAWGLYDMHGNVWEWCADWYDPRYYSTSADRDPLGPRAGERRVLRGGNWNSEHGRNLRSARRGKDSPTSATSYDGFRVVMIPNG